MQISNEVKLELEWWKSCILNTTNPIRELKYKIEIFSDASLTGWGACCDSQKTYGWWNSNFQKESINLLELKAVFNALSCFASDQHSCQILLRVDNKTAIYT